MHIVLLGWLVVAMRFCCLRLITPFDLMYFGRAKFNSLAAYMSINAMIFWQTAPLLKEHQYRICVFAMALSHCGWIVAKKPPSLALMID